MSDNGLDTETNSKNMKIKTKTDKSLRVLDLFAGAGGLSEGFINAGCNMIGHLEMDPASCKTLITRMVYHALKKINRLEEYVLYVEGKVTLDEIIKKNGLEEVKESIICAKIGKDNCQSLVEDIKKKLKGEKIDIIVGGPPCQAYSNIGRARSANNMVGDERNFLYEYYVEFLKAFKPKIFVFENVPGLLTAGGGKYLKSMRELMKEVGYETDFQIHNTVEFGVPQNRKRIILIGWSKESKLTTYPTFKKVEREYLVREFLGDLPAIKAGGGEKLIETSKTNPLLESLGISNPDFKYHLDHIARPHSERDLEIYKLAVEEQQQGRRIKYNTLPERLKTHKNDKIFLDRFKVVDENEKGSQTVVAHISKDGHYYIHPDLSQNRSLSVREAARLQTFPDDYKFEGTRTDQLHQIGNAVPPMFSAIIANLLIKYI